MCKRCVFLILFVSVMGLAGNTSAAVLSWDDSGPDSLWSTAANWSSNTVPTAEDDAIIEMDPGAIIDAGVMANALNVKIADAADSTGRITMTGGMLTVHQTGSGGPGLWISNRGTGYFDMSGGTIVADNVYLPRNVPGVGYMTLSKGSITAGQTYTLGLHSGEYGELTMTGGTIHVGSMFRCADLGQALVTMRSGEIVVDGTFFISRRDGTGHLQLDGGTITTTEFLMDPQGGSPTATMDITGGTLIIQGDVTGAINGYVADGWITAYGGGGDVEVRLVDSDTVVTASLGANAWNPSPQDGAVDVPLDTILSWTPGEHALKHDAYFGTSLEEVSRSSDPNVLPGWGRQDSNIFDPGTLTLGQTYYWRVDEVNEAETPAVQRGNVWSFTTSQYVVIDDFEDYNDYEPDRIFDTWADGWEKPANGSQIGYIQPPFIEQFIVQDGTQCTAFYYDNSGEAKYSEAVRSIDNLKDWTETGARALSLWLYGNLHNVPDRMYVALEDSTGASTSVYHDDFGAVIMHAWQEWNIDLTKFSDAGVDLTCLSRLYIGIGDKENPSSGASGMLYLDSIRLYPRRCVAEYAPAGDLDGDCDVDNTDIDRLSEHWLESFVWDATGGYDGNGCLQLDGAGDRIFIPAAPFPRKAFTYALWFNPNIDLGTESSRMDLIYWSPGGPDPGARPALVHNIDGSGRFRVSIMLENMLSGEQGLAFTDSRAFDASTWYHIAFTFDGEKTRVYVNGKRENTLTFSGVHQKRYTPGLYFGASSHGGNAFNGKLDDIRIYDYAVPESGIANLYEAAGEPAPGPVVWYKLDETASGTVSDSSGNGYEGYVLFVEPYTNPYDDNQVDFKDFAVLAETWLEEHLWPKP